ncbi:MAG: RICIN domain-containing protein [Gammaproteobacteria bacterium]|nr:RICIN domain-containing protein [Gammaproteobacteria bacterium]
MKHLLFLEAIRRYLKHYLAIALLINLPLVTANENCDELPQDGQLYSIINVSSGAALDVAGAAQDAFANVLAWQYTGSANQHFYFHQQDDEYWTIQAQHSGMNLDVLDLATQNGANIIQWHPTTGTNQQWRLRRSTTGGFNIVARHSSKSITVAGSDNGANIYQKQYASNASQKWYLNPVNKPCKPQSKVIGFAGVAGPDGLTTTDGGNASEPVIVTSCEQLRLLAHSNSPTHLQIPDNTTIDCRTPARNQPTCEIRCPDYQDPNKSIFRIPVADQSCRSLGAASEQRVNKVRREQRINIGSNTLLEGLGKNARVRGASFNLQSIQNVIIRNLQIEDVNPELVEAGDGITIENSSHVVIEHIRFRLISDGHVDIKNSANISLGWNRFEGYNPAVCGNQHHYTHLIHNTEITLHHNFWNHTSGRNPKLTGSATRAHLFNNLWKNITYFAVAVSDGAQAKLENNYFESSSKPHWNDGSGFIDGGNASNVYTGRSRTSPERHTGDAWVLQDTLWYPYDLAPARTILHPLDAQTGPQN